MKIPDINLLDGPQQRWLLDLDKIEFFGFSKNNFAYLKYKARFNKIIEIIKRFSPGKKILDTGCATANMGFYLAEQGFEVFAFDLQMYFIKYARLKYEKGKIHFINADLMHPPFKMGFDCVILGDVIEHLAYPETAVMELSKLLKKNGILIITTPNGDYIRKRSSRLLYSIANRDILAKHQLEPGGDGHLFSLNNSDFNKIIKNNIEGMSMIWYAYYNTPWITGNMKMRYLRRLLPLKLNLAMNKLFLNTPVLRKYFGEGLIVVLRKNKE